MISFNTFEKNRKDLVKDILRTELIGYTDQLGYSASFDNVAWKYTYPNGQKINIYFANYSQIPTKKHMSFGHISDNYKIEDSKRYLMMAYTFDVIAECTSVETKRGKLRACRNFMIELECELHELTQEILNQLFEGFDTTSGRYRKSFVKWLAKKQLIPINLKTSRLRDSYDGYDRIEAIKEKMPEDKCIAALGAICHEVIPSDEGRWDLSFTKERRYEFTCTMAALALSSPNRVAAEQIALKNQKIKTKKLQNGQYIHWLDWQGSKGYKDNQNHLLANMNETLTRALKYTRAITEPARILARFYETPNEPLKNLLGTYQVSQSRIKNATASVDKPVNLIQLGYLLGFFDEDAVIITPPETTGSVRPKRKRYHRKKMYLLKPEDHVYVRENTSAYELFGSNMKQRDIDLFLGCKAAEESVSVKEFQVKWISHIYKSIPSFPYCLMESGNKVKFSSMMFAFTGRQLKRDDIKGGNAGVGSCSWFYLGTGERLAGVFSSMLGSSNPASRSIFSEFGFKKEFKITPHQFRHWLNDTGERSGIPHKILNLWSKRASAEHIINYLHSSEDERTGTVRDIIFSDEEEQKSIKVYSRSEYEKLTGIADGISSLTSTGFCTQNLLTSPCEYMNDFETQCTLCSSACHVKGDHNSLDLLQKDYQYQVLRLDTIKQKSNFYQSNNLQKWFDIHHRNTQLLKELISLMESPKINDSSVIRVLASISEIRITDVQLKTVTTRKLSLPCSKSALEKTIAELNIEDNNTFSSLLAMLPES
ncbi:hypothetical protein [Vibrio crassostreae]|uniref:hypothetical protein n=1 Tax=Vibrio crassostreae TaxID=246167 RepID=UPI001B30F4D8|nr:hypothetical protein [Vibrio crassostreae]CAK1757211.1 putative Integrase [Vibrio crassostreae]CAK2546895.1 putative Integrase [Vibrio crassostreae]CAK3298967.1 putative Integrase [Vibrio crassostreae]